MHTLQSEALEVTVIIFNRDSSGKLNLLDLCRLWESKMGTLPRNGHVGNKPFDAKRTAMAAKKKKGERRRL
jgi:hypothetical protein